MPTASLIQFWLNGWGPSNTLVPDEVDLLALADAPVGLLALSDRQLVLAGLAGSTFASPALASSVIALVAKSDAPVDLNQGG